MRILYVWDADYPWDVRTEKVCRALTDAGHRVVIAARNLAGRPVTEALPEGTVERLAPGPAWGRRWRSFPAFFNPYWIAHLRRSIRRHAIELVIVRDLPLAPTALFAAGSGVPVVLDMAEHYPAMIRDIWADGRQGPLDVLVRNPALVAAVERQVIGRMAHVITVVEESSERLVAMGLPTERTSVVSNTPPSARVVSPPPARDPRSPLRLIYLGLMERHRGIGCLLDAAAILASAGRPFHLDLVGDGRDLDEFRAQAARLGLGAGQVTFHGRLPHGEAIAHVGRAHLGIVPHVARESWNSTIPNKLFDYMAAGLAVITSDAKPAARVVRATGAGLVFPSGDAAALSACISEYEDLSTWERHRAAGQAAVRTRYNWEFDTRVLLDVVEGVTRVPAAVRTTASPSPVLRQGS